MGRRGFLAGLVTGAAVGPALGSAASGNVQPQELPKSRIRGNNDELVTLLKDFGYRDETSIYEIAERFTRIFGGLVKKYQSRFKAIRTKYEENIEGIRLLLGTEEYKQQRQVIADRYNEELKKIIEAIAQDTFNKGYFDANKPLPELIELLITSIHTAEYIINSMKNDKSIRDTERQELVENYIRRIGEAQLAYLLLMAIGISTTKATVFEDTMVTSIDLPDGNFLLINLSSKTKSGIVRLVDVSYYYEARKGFYRFLQKPPSPVQRAKLRERMRYGNLTLDISPGDKLWKVLAVYCSSMHLMNTKGFAFVVYMILAVHFIRSGLYDQAREELEQAKKLNETFDEIHILLGIVYTVLLERESDESRKKELAEGAANAFRSALYYNSRNPNTYMQIGSFYMTEHMNQWQKAVEVFNEAIKLGVEESVGLYASLGKAYFRLKQFGAAASWNDKAIKLDPHNKDHYYNLGSCYANLEGDENWKKAVDAFVEAVKLGYPLDDSIPKDVRIPDEKGIRDAVKKRIQSPMRSILGFFIGVSSRPSL